MSEKKKEQFYFNLKEHVGEKKFTLIFSSLQVVAVNEHSVDFSVSAEIFRKKIEAQKKLLLNLCQELWGEIEEVTISVHSDVNAADFSQSFVANLPEAPSPPAPSKQKERPLNKTSLSLRQNFNFQNFVVGPSNEFAASVARAIANNPGQTSYNPCLVYGKVGLGKTHLLQAIGNDIRKNIPRFEILYLSAEQFVNNFISAVRNNKMGKFRNIFRTIDILLIDDIQFLSGKEQTQDELFHTFNALHHNFKQMVFSSDRPINLIKDVEERLISRFQSGMCVDLHPPTTEMAIGILSRALEMNKQEHLVSFEIINYISTHLRSNIRDMLSFLNRITGYILMTNKTVTLDMVREWIIDVQPRNQEKQNLSNKIIKEVAGHFEVGVSELKGGGRRRAISRIRRIAMYLLREYTELSHTEIGALFNVTHVSCLKAVEKVENELNLGTGLNEQILAIKSKIID